MNYFSRLMLFVILSGCTLDFVRNNDPGTDSDQDTESENEAATCTYVCMPETECINEFGGTIRGELTCADENDICCEPTRGADTGSDRGVNTDSETLADTESETQADTGSDTVIDTESETQADTDSTTAQDPSIEDIVAQTYVLQNFEALLVMTGIFEDMQSPPYTIFSPWDYSLDNLLYWEEMTADSAWWGHMRDLTLGHITQGNLPYEELEDNMAVTMLNGDVAIITVENDRPRVDGFRFIGNTAASDGYFYLLQDVREPKWTKRTILDIINSDERFSILAQILNHPSMSAKREELSATESRLTFFAPTNEALVGFNIGNCTEPDCLVSLDLLVGNHLVDRLVPKLFTPSQGFVTHAGSSLNWYFSTKIITCTNEDKTREEVELDATDEEFASNGIVYPIDTLLCTTINQQ